MKNYQKIVENLGSYNFPAGLLGFEKVHQYDINPLECKPYLMLANYDIQLGFICTDPTIITPNYEVQITEQEKTLLNTINIEDIAVLAIVRVMLRGHYQINLLGPILLNVKSKTAFQKAVIGQKSNVRFNKLKIGNIDSFVRENKKLEPKKKV